MSMKEHKIYVGNLSYDVTTDDLQKLFEEFDGLVKANVITDRDTGRSKGFAFVEFDNGESVTAAIEKFNGFELDNRALNVNEAKPRENKPRGGFGAGRNDRGGRGRY